MKVRLDIHGIVTICMVINGIEWYSTVLYSSDLPYNVIVILSDWHNTCVVCSESLKKVVCLACWILTGTLWHK